MRRPSNRRPADPGAGGFDTRPPPLMAADGTARLQDWEDNESRPRLRGLPRRSKAPPPTVVALHALDGVPVRVDPGMFVPRPHTQALAWRAVSLLPAAGIAVDLCTGSGAVAAVLGSAHPRATVVATDVDLVAFACARRNGIRALVGNLDEPLSPPLRGRVDVMTAVVPYVPSEELHLLPRDVLANEPVARSTADGAERRCLCGPPKQPRAGSARAAACFWRSAATRRARWRRPWRTSA